MHVLITARELKKLRRKFSTNFEIMLTRRFISKFTFETSKLKVRQLLIVLTPLTGSWWSLSIILWSKGNFSWSHVQLAYWFSLHKQREKYVRRATWPIDVANWLCQGTAMGTAFAKSGSPKPPNRILRTQISSGAHVFCRLPLGRPIHSNRWGCDKIYILYSWFTSAVKGASLSGQDMFETLLPAFDKCCSDENRTTPQLSRWGQKPALIEVRHASNSKCQK